MLFLLSLFPALLAGAISTESAEDDSLELTGTNDADSLNGGDGDDDLFGGLGDDTLTGGAGNDLIQGQGGADVLIGNEGTDAIQGRGENDTVQGFTGDDWVDGNDGDDLVRGGFGDDVVIGGEGADALFGRADDDILIGGELTSSPLSNADLDVVRSGGDATQFLNNFAGLEDDEDADSLDGGSGEDFLIFGAGDTAFGGSGEDGFAIFADAAGSDAGTATIQDYTSGSDVIFVYFQEGDAPEDAEITVEDDGDDAVVSVDGEELARVLGAAGELSADQIEIAQPAALPTEIEEVTGNDDDETFDGTPGDDIINGAGGQDNIEGGNGDDTLNGDAGADIIQGQAGFDRINGNADNDLLQGRGGNDSLSGNQGEDWVDGNDGDDMVNGGTQQDTVVGGLGSDLLSGGEGSDVVISGEVLDDPLTTEQLSAIRDGATLADATGLALGDKIFLQDDGAADTLDGGNAADVLFFGAGDTATGGAGADQFGILADSAGNGLGEAVITDFVDGEDTLFLVLEDPSIAATPTVTVTDDGLDALVFADGQVLARVAGGAGVVTAGQVSLVEGVQTPVIDPNS